MFKQLKYGLVLVLLLCGCMEEKNIEYFKEGFIKISGGRLYYQVFGKGEPMIVLHGGPGLDQSYLLPQMNELAKANKVIFYDQRDSGKSLSRAFDPKKITLNQFIEDIEIVRKNFGIKKFILVGHSFGGRLAMEYAVIHPERVKALILMHSAGVTYAANKDFLNTFNAKTKSISAKLTPLFNLAEFMKLDLLQIVNLFRDVFAAGYFYNPLDINKLSLDSSLEGIRSGKKVEVLLAPKLWGDEKFDLRPKLKKLKIPTLIIQGDDDVFITSTGKEINDAIPNSRLVTLKHCGHFGYIEQPGEFFEEIHNFLEQQLTGK